MFEVFVTYWEPRKGYIIKWITGREKHVPSDLLELIFFRALGSPEHRVESMYWVQNFFSSSYQCYYIGAYTEIPIIVVGHGEPENVVKSIIYDLAIKIRSFGLDELDEKLPYNYDRIIRNLSPSTLNLFVLNNELILQIYLILLENPIIKYNDLAELVFHENIASSIKDLDDALILLNMVGFIRVLWVMGSKWIELLKVLVPLRRPNAKLISKNRFEKVFNKWFSRRNLFKEIKFSTNVFIDPALRRLLANLKTRRRISYDLSIKNELDFLIQANYIIRDDSAVFFNTEPVIRIFNIAGSKVWEFSI